MFKDKKDKSFDWFIFVLYLSLLGIGWVMLFSVTHSKLETNDFIDFLTKTKLGKQSLWIIISLFTFFVLILIDSIVIRTFSYVFYLLNILLLIAVLFVGLKINGAMSWFSFGGFSFQPSELAKVGTALGLAGFLSSPAGKMNSINSFLIGISIIILPIILILLQPDLGSVIVFFAFFVVLFIAGAPSYPFFLGLSTIAIFIITLSFGVSTSILIILLFSLMILMLSFEDFKIWGSSFIIVLIASIVVFVRNEESLSIFTLIILNILLLFLKWRKGKFVFSGLLLTSTIYTVLVSIGSSYVFQNIIKPHQKERIDMWLHPERCNPYGPLYNVLQSKLAISFGGLWGRGFGEGKFTKLGYIPEQTTDFIFCTIAEEQGFIGSTALIIIFSILIYRIIKLANRQRLLTAKYFAWSFATILFIHVFVNIGMTMGLVPVVGIPLPFISKGGSSLLTFSIFMAIMLRMDVDNVRA